MWQRHLPGAPILRALTVAGLGAGLGAATGCGVPTTTRLPEGTRPPRVSRLASATSGTLAIKVVAAKEPPSTIVAQDGSSCLVTERRYDRIDVGSRALCTWRADTRSP
jgi:hypothetical protein